MTPPGSVTAAEIFYPESDGKPMAENSRQFDCILMIAANLRVLFRLRNDVVVSGNQFWYPEEGHPELVQAPDVYVVFGRPKGDRSSWKQWEEENTPLTVVFEILSPGNDRMEMSDKLAFYVEYGVEEYYIYDPETNALAGYLRKGTALRRVRPIHNHISPRLGIRFDLSGPELVIRYPDGRPFLPIEELDQQRVEAEDRAEQAEDRANKAENRADRAEERLARLAELTAKVILQQASTEEQEELKGLLAIVKKP